MSKRKSKKEKILVMTSLEATRAAMPKFYPACRCGKHKSKKDYDRKDKSWKNEEGYQLEQLFLGFFLIIISIIMFALCIVAANIVIRIWINFVSPWLDDKIGPLQMKTTMNMVMNKFNEVYTFLYNNEDKIPNYKNMVALGDRMIGTHDKFVTDFIKYRGDFLTSDREVAAFACAVLGIDMGEFLND